MHINNLRVLIVAEHASLKFGGEAALPLHYFRVLRQRGINTWLVVHERTREELQSLFESERDRIYFVSDTFWHCFVWQCSQILPKRLADFTFGLVLRMMTQIDQHRIAKKIVQEQQIDIIHQPILVSPKEPSMIFHMGVPVVIGPMNGGMKYPPAFRHRESGFVNLSVEIGRLFANLLNALIPGKLKATTLLVANQRTKEALPKGIGGKVIEIVENGVDLSIWKPSLGLEESGENIKTQHPKKITKQPIRFVFVGRLVEWKAVDLLILAFKRVREQIPVELEIIGDGKERQALEALAKEQGLIQLQKPELATPDLDSESPKRAAVNFTGFLSQIDCAQRLQLADVMVLPSLHECGGAVVLEAMTMGIPVIATNWGGPADYLDESCGILVEPTTRDSFINDLATAMLKMAKSPELRQAMGKAGRQRILDHFDWEVKVDTMLTIYQEAIDRYAKKATVRISNTKANTSRLTSAGES
ncbi:MAG: glycosyltransferase family 4 protein [Xenococcaceae cyanobacterium MO_188.B32]|nr:glycosyltransferase family 4 protein [Xenococcaceae cyanobacterium MO_188.B32]